MSRRANFGTIEQKKASPSGKERRKAKQKEAARGELPNAVVVLAVLTQDCQAQTGRLKRDLLRSTR